jgi:MYXO-CTERM domain-containing protein
MYVRTAWDEDAFWGVFTSAPQINSDHHHPDTANFAFSRGGDHLIVDPSTYGDRGTLPTNAVTADSPGVAGDYAPSQTPWNASELVWARATSPAVYAARSDFANAFIFSSNPSDIPYAHREWVFLPEGEIVAIDRVVTADASHFMYLGFHANTAGTLTLSGSDATGTVGSSKVVIHGVELSGATPVITSPTVGDCFSTPAFGACTAVRFQVDEYTAKVPGPNALAIHVVDGIGATESPATVASMTDATIDPTHANAGVVGAAVTRNGVVSYVVASSAPMGASGATMTYSVPGATPARHVVYDAPESSNGESSVTAAAQAGACVLTITAGSGFTGHPLMFGMASAGGGCTVTDGTALPPNTGGGPDAGTGGGDGGGVGSGADASGGGGGANDGGANGAAPTSGGGCGCHLGEPAGSLGLAALGAGIVAIAIRRRRR